MKIDTDAVRGRSLVKDLIGDLLRSVVIRPVLKWQDRRCRRARAYLLTHDAAYRANFAGLEIIRRRQEMYDAGISPADPRIPDRWSIEEELPPMSWPRNSIFIS